MYNQNFYNNFPRNNFTFHNESNFAPPPPPPPSTFFIPPFNNAIGTNTTEITDQDFLKKFENMISSRKESNVKHKVKPILISDVKERLRTLVFSLKQLKEKETILSQNITKFCDEEWKKEVEEIERSKAIITESMCQINGLYLEMLRKFLAKRAAKRLRLKRVHMERKMEREQRKQELKERSRKIDENLQKIKDDFNRAKQEEEAKIQADIVLKEVLRRKHEAKKFITKLDALIKLRRARQNTAKGRGATVSEKEADTFNKNIEKLKSLWIQKLASYDIEEAGLRAKLKQDAGEQDTDANKKEKEVIDNLTKWREFLFGDASGGPQVNFYGDVGRFVAIRSQWDKFLNDEGSPLPVGWVVPQS